MDFQFLVNNLFFFFLVSLQNSSINFSSTSTITCSPVGVLPLKRGEILLDIFSINLSKYFKTSTLASFKIGNASFSNILFFSLSWSLLLISSCTNLQSSTSSASKSKIFFSSFNFYYFKVRGLNKIIYWKKKIGKNLLFFFSLFPFRFSY